MFQNATDSTHLLPCHFVLAHQRSQHPLVKSGIYLTALDSRTDVEPAADFALCQAVHVLRHIVYEVKAGRKLEMVHESGDERCN